MKSFLLLTMLFLFGHANGQLWKAYADSAKSFMDAKRNDRAIVYYNKAREALKPDSMMTATYAQNSHTLANVYMGVEGYKEAEPLYLEARQIREKVLGKNAAYAATCTNLAQLYSYTGRFRESETLFLEAKAIQEKVLGNVNASYSATCNNLGALYQKTGEYEKAVLLFLEAKQIREKLYGKVNPLYAGTSQNLANLYLSMGQYLKAEELYLEGMQIWEKLYGKNLDYSVSCNNLGLLYRNTGSYKKAEALFLEAKEIREVLLGKEDPDYVAPLNNLASLYEIMGQYAQAEQLFIEGKQIQENTIGKNDPLYALSCNNLATFYMNLGQYGKAEPLFLEAKQIQEKDAGKEHSAYASTCNNLAMLYWNTGQNKKAEQLYSEGRNIIAKQLGKTHPAYALSNLKLADLLQRREAYKEAESLYMEAKQIQETVLGKEHPEYASTCDNLAGLYLKMGQYAKAEPLYLEAKNIYEKQFGKYHPDYGSVCSRLANLYWLQGDFFRANKEFYESFSVNAYNQSSVFQFTNEKEKSDYITNILGEDEIAYSFYLTARINDEIPYSLSLFHRNLILSFSNTFRQQLASSTDTALINKYNEWIHTREQLSLWLSKPIAERKGKDILLEEKADQLEKKLTILSSNFRMQNGKPEISSKSVQQFLRPGEAAIEFASFKYYNGKRWTDSTYYIAFIVKKDMGEPVLVQLFEKGQLDSVLRITKSIDLAKTINLRYSRNNALFKLIWQPLEKELAGIQKVYYAPSGMLYEIPLAALAINDKERVGDKYKLSQISTTADIVNPLAETIGVSDKLYLYGGILYDGDTSAFRQAAVQYNMKDLVSRSLPDEGERGNTWRYLAGTKTEVENIEKLGSQKAVVSRVSTGWNSTEESVKSLNGSESPSVLHIATHAFFYPDPKVKPDRSVATEGRVFRQSDNPFLRSGLIMAGANFAWNGNPVPGIEDGILTSFEVSNLYLPNTKLAVLSACETGLGDIQGSEGVYGLQRAFKIAGVKNLIMSLWQVPDEASAEFMTDLYKNMFAGKSIEEAFNSTHNSMKNKYLNEPYKWAAWILVR